MSRSKSLICATFLTLLAHGPLAARLLAVTEAPPLFVCRPQTVGAPAALTPHMSRSSAAGPKAPAAPKVVALQPRLVRIATGPASRPPAQVVQGRDSLPATAKRLPAFSSRPAVGSNLKTAKKLQGRLDPQLGQQAPFWQILQSLVSTLSDIERQTAAKDRKFPATLSSGDGRVATLKAVGARRGTKGPRSSRHLHTLHNTLTTPRSTQGRDGALAHRAGPSSGVKGDHQRTIQAPQVAFVTSALVADEEAPTAPAGEEVAVDGAPTPPQQNEAADDESSLNGDATGYVTAEPAEDTDGSGEAATDQEATASDATPAPQADEAAGDEPSVYGDSTEVEFVEPAEDTDDSGEAATEEETADDDEAFAPEDDEADDDGSSMEGEAAEYESAESFEDTDEDATDEAATFDDEGTEEGDEGSADEEEGPPPPAALAGFSVSSTSRVVKEG